MDEKNFNLRMTVHTDILVIGYSHTIFHNNSKNNIYKILDLLPSYDLMASYSHTIFHNNSKNNIYKILDLLPS